MIKSGLEAGDRVVVDGGKLLSSGQPVTYDGDGHEDARHHHRQHLVSALVTTGCKQETKAPEPVRPVLSTVVEPTVSGSAIAVGTVEPRFRTNLGFRVLGRLIARPVNVGDLVVQGQTVAAIDSTALELAVRSARAELSKSQAQLANAERDGGAATEI